MQTNIEVRNVDLCDEMYACMEQLALIMSKEGYDADTCAEFMVDVLVNDKDWRDVIQNWFVLI